MDQVALVIIYNHKYDKNISLLEDMYGSRFSNIYHLVPFYTGEKENVIAVYENSFYFQGYIAQARQILESKGDFNHYFFIGDDLFLNPEINENNYCSYFHLDNDKAFLPGFTNLSDSSKWSHLPKAVNYNPKQMGVEIEQELPSYDEILKRFTYHKLPNPYVLPENIYPMPNRSHYPKTLRGMYSYFHKRKEVKALYKEGKIRCKIPLVISYSDILIIPSKNFKLFSHYCGVFSATNLFVEMAVPTAMVMVCDQIEIETEKSAMKGLIFWEEKREEFEKKFDFSMKKLNENFPANILYLHPVKLSKWK